MDGTNFQGHQQRECGEHRTVGPHRAWCLDCSEWCYPSDPCARCEIAQLRAIKAAALDLLNALAVDEEWDHLIVEQRSIDAVSTLSALVRRPDA